MQSYGTSQTQLDTLLATVGADCDSICLRYRHYLLFGDNERAPCLIIVVVFLPVGTNSQPHPTLETRRWKAVPVQILSPVFHALTIFREGCIARHVRLRTRTTVGVLSPQNPMLHLQFLQKILRHHEHMIWDQ